MQYCGNPECTRKRPKDQLYLAIGFEGRVCKNCFVGRITMVKCQACGRKLETDEEKDDGVCKKCLAE